MFYRKRIKRLEEQLERLRNETIAERCYPLMPLSDRIKELEKEVFKNSYNAFHPYVPCGNRPMSYKRGLKDRVELIEDFLGVDLKIAVNKDKLVKKK